MVVELIRKWKQVVNKVHTGILHFIVISVYV